MDTIISESMMCLGKKSSVIRSIFEYGKARKAQIGAENVFDFSLGNPNVPAPKSVNDCIRRLLDTMDPIALHGYTSAPGDMRVRQTMADELNEKYHTDAAKGNLIYMTCGAAASLTVSLHAVVCPGDEVIAIAPFFPEYRVFAEKAGAKLVVVPSRNDNMLLDLEAIRAAVTGKTKAIIINSPNNPSGAILPASDIRALSEILLEAEKKYNHAIFLISDEPYRELVYTGEELPFAGEWYPDTLICYSFSKTLSLPGERIGYIAVSSRMENAGDVFAAICGAGRALGFVCAPSLWQYVAAECIRDTADLSVYAENRRIFNDEFSRIGYDFILPDGAFYLFMRSPEPDAYAFCERAKKYELLLVPSDDFGMPGFVRIAYCVSTDQVKRSIPAFEALFKEYN